MKASDHLKTTTIPIALTVAGSDSGGGAGIQADLKTFAAFGVYGCSAITAITAQNTRGVDGIWPVSGLAVAEQIESVRVDMHVKAIKTGMLFNGEVITAVLAALKKFEPVPLVVDPVLVASSGDSLYAASGEEELRDQAAAYWQLLRCASVITPNLSEAAQLLTTDCAASEPAMRDQGHQLMARGVRAVLLKGGHLDGNDCVDLLFWRDGKKLIEQEFRGARIDSQNTHGTGCTLAAAITAGLAQQQSLVDAVAGAKHYLSRAIAHAKSQLIGRGSGPVQHFFNE